MTFSFASIMAETVTAFLRQHTYMKVNVTQSTMTELMTQLENHELDFVLAFKPQTANPKVESRELFHHRLAAIVNEHCPCQTVHLGIMLTVYVFKFFFRHNY